MGRKSKETVTKVNTKASAKEKYKLKDLLKDVEKGETIFIHKYLEQGNLVYIWGQDEVNNKLLNSEVITVMTNYGGIQYNYACKLYIVK